MNLDMNELSQLSVKELENELMKELKNVEDAKSRFTQKKIDLSLNYKRIDPKVEKIKTTIDIRLTEQSIKQDLIKRIMAARLQVKKIDSMTSRLGTLSFSEFESTFNSALTESRVVSILRNLGATDEEIEELLQTLRGDEDYEELKDIYNTYKIDKFLEDGDYEEMSSDEYLDSFSNPSQ